MSLLTQDLDYDIFLTTIQNMGQLKLVIYEIYKSIQTVLSILKSYRLQGNNKSSIQDHTNSVYINIKLYLNEHESVKNTTI